MARDNRLWGAPRIYLFFIIGLASCRVVHFGVTRHPSDAWVAQQLHEATAYGQAPRFLIRDRHRNVWRCVHARRAGQSQLILGECQLYRVIKEHVQFFNEARPHPQGARGFW